MKKILIALLLTVSLSAHGAESFDDGVQALNNLDYAAALRIFTKYAEQGNASAQDKLGLMYFVGWGVPEDDKEAVKWFRLAAEQGQSLAQVNLGTLYYRGGGVPQSYVYAHMWWNIAASDGSDRGAKNRDLIAAKKRDLIAAEMTPDQIAKAQELARECAKNDYKGC